MRVLQLHTPYREAGGEDAVVKAEAALLRRIGHDVVQHQVPNPSGAIGAAAALASSAWNPLAAHRVRSVALATRPDVAHVHNTWFAQSPAVISSLHRCGVPVVMTLHNYRLMCANGQLFRDGAPCDTCVGAAPWAAVRHACYRSSRALSLPASLTIAVHQWLGTWDRDVALFLALNDFAKGKLLEGGLPGDRIRVKPNFVADPGPRRQEAGASRQVLYVGRLSAEKGVGNLLRAWAEASPARLELVIVGDGPQRSELEGRSPRGVTFTGRLPHDEVRRRMLSARALVLPSIWYEGQPMVVLEALAAGLPVLASRLGGMPELLRPLGPEWLVGPERGTLPQALLRLADDSSVRRASAQARRHYEASFSEDVAAQALEESYRLAISRRRRTAPIR